MHLRVKLVENSPLYRVPSLIISHPHLRSQLLFNTVPALLRHRRTHGLNLRAPSHLFFTQDSPHCLAGLPNLMLFRSGSEHNNYVTASQLAMYGSRQLANYWEKLRFKIGPKILRFAWSSWSKGQVRWAISSIPLFMRVSSDPKLPTYFLKVQEWLRNNARRGDYLDASSHLTRQGRDSFFRHNQMDVRPIIVREGELNTTHYLCQPHPLRAGRDINVEQFMERTGVRRVQDIRRFIKEGRLEMPDGRVLSGRDFAVEEDFTPSSIVILQHTTPTALRSLQQHDTFKQHCQTKKTALVVHIVQDASLIAKPMMKELLRSLEQNNKDTYHLWFHQSLATSVQVHPHVKTYRLYQQAFPNLLPPIAAEQKQSDTFQDIVKQYYPSYRHIFHAPLHQFDKNDHSGHNYGLKADNSPTGQLTPIVEQILQKYSAQIASLNELVPPSSSSHQPHVTFLGTASSMPTLTRNTLGILLSLTPGLNILLDCGQGTLQQLHNHLGPNLVQQLLKLRVVFISHIHSDHNLGLLSLISERNRIIRETGGEQGSKLIVVMPFNVFNWYHQFSSTVEDLSQGCEVLFTQVLQHGDVEQLVSEQKGGQNSKNSQLTQQIIGQLRSNSTMRRVISPMLPHQSSTLSRLHSLLHRHGYSLFRPVRVTHCPQAYGIVVQQGQHKVSFSGDTGPCQQFTAQAADSTLLIHEATFNDPESDKAHSSLHCTVRQALEQAMKARAKHLAITHFNQDFQHPEVSAYPQPMLDYYRTQTVVTIDHLQVDLSQMQHLPAITQLISKVQQEAHGAYLTLKSNKGVHSSGNGQAEEDYQAQK